LLVVPPVVAVPPDDIGVPPVGAPPVVAEPPVAVGGSFGELSEHPPITVMAARSVEADK
jgi:hypothetical protein